MGIISQDFYNRNTLEVAKDLLGCKLCRRAKSDFQGCTPASHLSGIIVEVEAYTQEDPACHAYRGKTPRSATLFKQPGIAYVYFIYGMYHCVNVVTEEYDRAGAVLIRALEPIPPAENTNGPGKLCRALNITKELNEADVTSEDSDLWIEEGIIVPKKQIIETTRIGIKLAADFPWRFYIKDNKFVSRK